jgi:ABC-type multidrug transport system ATPase subunit
MSKLLWRLEDLRFGYAGQPELLHIPSLQIQAGDFILLRGENGSGKSTLLKLLTGDLSPVSGTLMFKDKKPDKQAAAVFRDIFLLRQKTSDNLFGLVPGHDLLVWQLAHPNAFTDATQQQLLQTTANTLETPFSRFSTGELQAYALAPLTLLKDRFWLLDEPTAGLDTERKAAFFALCREKRVTQQGFLIISHDTSLPDELFTRKLLLEQGNLLELS